MTKAEREVKQKVRAYELRRIERELAAQGFHFIAGVDEVGRGPLAGPVVAAACVLPADFEGLGIDDSKKLTEKKRELLAEQIRDAALCYGIGEADNRVIDRINILQATKVAMRRAIEKANEMLLARCGEEIDYVLFDAMEIREVELPQRSIIKGDATSISIAAASILAKVCRDHFMVEMDDVYPGYGFAQHKGYGTAAHYQALRAQGMTEIHRRSFLKNL